jgi:pyruvate dehydrogenase E1 component alpha subunit
MLTEADLARIEQEVGAEMDSAVQFAEMSPFEPVEELLKDVSAAVKP